MGVSVHRACELMGIRRNSFYYQAMASDDGPLREAIRKRQRGGCPRIADRLWREGWTDNYKRMERVHREEQLQTRRRRKRMSRGRAEALGEADEGQ